MNGAKRQAKLLRVTALSAALMAVYGEAGADTVPNPSSVSVVVNDDETKALKEGITYSSITVNSGGTLTSDASDVSVQGGAYNLVHVMGTATLTGVDI